MKAVEQMETKFKSMNRQSQLTERYERLISLNEKNHYTQSGNSKIDKYLNCLLAIRKERVAIWNERRKNEVYSRSLEVANNNIIKFLKR